MEIIPIELRRTYDRHVASFDIIANRKDRLSNIWFFDSPKNRRREVIRHDIAFVHIVLHEGDLNIDRYDIEPNIGDATGKRESTVARILFKDGSTVRYKYQWAHNKKETSPHSEGDRIIESDESLVTTILTENEFHGREYEFDNWLNLCSYINRMRHYSHVRELQYIQGQFERRKVIPLTSLYEADGFDPSIILGVVARMLQTGYLTTDLKSSLFGLGSVLQWRKA